MRYYHISLNQTDVSTKSAPYSPPKEGEPAAVYLLSYKNESNFLGERVKNIVKGSKSSVTRNLTTYTPLPNKLFLVFKI